MLKLPTCDSFSIEAILSPSTASWQEPSGDKHGETTALTLTPDHAIEFHAILRPDPEKIKVEIPG